jgi:hypothetical protein
MLSVPSLSKMHDTIALAIYFSTYLELLTEIITVGSWGLSRLLVLLLTAERVTIVEYDHFKSS